jgi:hypothetical protein
MHVCSTEVLMLKPFLAAVVSVAPSLASAGEFAASAEAYRRDGADQALIREARVDCYDQQSGQFIHPGPCRGENRHSPGGHYGGHSGYRLYFDGRKVSGPDAPGYTRRQAEENCAWNVRTKPGLSIRCTYDGVTFFEN